MERKNLKWKIEGFFIALLVFLSLMSPLLFSMRLLAVEAGSIETIRATGGKTYVHVDYAGGAKINLSISRMEDTRDKATVFCVEPQTLAGIEGQEYEARHPDGTLLSGWSGVLQSRVASDTALTKAQRQHLSLWVHWGWDKSPNKSETDYVAVQVYFWEYLWPVKVSFKDAGKGREVRALQKEIAEKIAAHSKKSEFESNAYYDAKKNVLTIRPGQQVTLKDKNLVLKGSKVTENGCNIETEIKGNDLILKAGPKAKSGIIRLVRHPDISVNANSWIYYSSEYQKVARFKTEDPVKFFINVKAVRKGALEITKTDESGKTLDGAVFELKDANGKIVQLKKVGDGSYERRTSGQTRFGTHKGKVRISELPEGSYTLTEVVSPKGHLPSKSLTAKVTAEKTAKLTVKNETQRFTVEVLKTDAETGQALAGAEFQLRDPKGVVLETLKTGKDGKAKSKGHFLKYPGGTYRVVEIKAPKGYTKDDKQVRNLVVKPDGKTALLRFSTSFKNEAQRFTVEVLKTDADTAKALAGAEFQLRDPKGVVLEILKTGKDGKAKSKAHVLKYPGGTYRLVEIKAPPGYLKAAKQVNDLVVKTDGKAKLIHMSTAFKNKRQAFRAEILKQSKQGKVPLEGAVFELRNAKGDLLETMKSDARGRAVSRYYPLPDEAENYVLTEVEAPPGFKLDGEAERSFTVKADTSEKNLVLKFTYENEQMAVPVPIQKFDQEYGDKRPPEADFSGAEYEIRAVELSHEGSCPYKAGETADRLTTDGSGKAVSKPLYPGVYELWETKAPAGYLLNPLPVRFAVIEDEESLKIVQKSSNTKLKAAEQNSSDPEADVLNSELIRTGEQIIKGKVKIKKLLTTPLGPEGTAEPEEGIEFVIKNSLGEEVGRLLTDAEGTAESELLPFGTYRLEQLSRQAHAHEAEPLEFKIEEDGAVLSYTLENKSVVSKLKLIKVDAQSGRPIRQAGILFEIYREDGSKVQQYDAEGNLLDSFGTDEEGTVTLPQVLTAGNYILKETKAPDGYILPKEGLSLPFAITKETEAKLQGEPLVLEVPNQRAEGHILLLKSGEYLASWEEHEESFGERKLKVYKPVLVKRALADAVFEVRAKEDIFHPDGEQAFKAGDTAAVMVSNKDGKADSGPLPLGRYEVEEVQAPPGYARDPEIYSFELKEDESTKEILPQVLEAGNKIQKARVTFSKTMEESPWFGRYKGAGEKVFFGIFNREAMKIGDAVLPKDSCLGIASPDKEMKVSFASLLPFEHYYIRELKTADEYLLSGEILDVSFVPQINAGENNKIAIDEVFQNKLKPHRLILRKSDSADPEKMLMGAEFKLYAVNKKGEQEIGNYVTDENGEIQIENLHAGQYYLIETRAPEGYLLNPEKIPFTLDGRQTLLEKTAVNEASRVEVSKTDIAGKEIPGAKLEVWDSKGELIESWVSQEGESHVIRGLKFGETYTLKETLAPEGYVQAEEIQFSLNEDGSVTKVQMINERAPEITVTGEHFSEEKLYLLLTVTGLLLTLFIKRRRVK